MNPNGHRLANLTATPNADELWPNWRADGRKIAFMSNPVTAANPEGDYELFVMRADGSHPVQLTSNGLDDERPGLVAGREQDRLLAGLRSNPGPDRQRPVHDERRRHRPTAASRTPPPFRTRSPTGQRTAGRSPS